jgi:putative component of toxin-antitoxin plasmid stabilization module
VVVLVPRPPAIALEVKVRPAAQYRGDEPNVGDVAHLAVSGGQGARAIWVYREGVQLVLRCPGDPACQISESSTAVDLTLSAVGTYSVVAVTGDSLPTPTGDQGVDTAAARSAGLDVRQDHVTVTGVSGH